MISKQIRHRNIIFFFRRKVALHHYALFDSLKRPQRQWLSLEEKFKSTTETNYNLVGFCLVSSVQINLI